MRNSIQPLCQEYFDAVEAEKIANENKLKEEAEKAAAEKSLDGEDEDHDNRKLKKVRFLWNELYIYIDFNKIYYPLLGLFYSYFYYYNYNLYYHYHYCYYHNYFYY